MTVCVHSAFERTEALDPLCCLFPYLSLSCRFLLHVFVSVSLGVRTMDFQFIADSDVFFPLLSLSAAAACVFVAWKVLNRNTGDSQQSKKDSTQAPPHAQVGRRAEG